MSLSFPGRSGWEMFLQTRSVRGNGGTVTDFLPLNSFTGKLWIGYIELFISPFTKQKRRIP
jgi:hypothetical protein